MIDNKKDEGFSIIYKDSFHPFKSAEAQKEYVDYYMQVEKTWPVKYENVMVDTSYGSTHVRICGPENAPPLVLLPGDTQSSLSWKNQIETLSRDYRTYMPDQINDYGLSIRSKPIKNKQDFIAWLDELLKGLNLNNINLLGFSYGGGLSLIYTIAHPGKVNKLILIAPACRNWPLKPKVLFRLIIQDMLRTRKIITNHLYWECSDAVKKNDITHSIVDDMINDLMLCRKCFKKHKWIMPFMIKNDEWRNIKAPTYFIVGENDVLVSAHEAVQLLNTVAPNIKTTIISEAGHDLLIVKSEVICKEILNFLRN